MLENCIKLVRSNLQKTLSPLLKLLVSIYMKLSPIGGKLVAPELFAGLFDFVARTNLFILPLPFLSLLFIAHLVKNNHHYYQHLLSLYL